MEYLISQTTGAYQYVCRRNKTHIFTMYFLLSPIYYVLDLYHVIYKKIKYL